MSEMKRSCDVILAAAGSGTRFGGPVNKVLVPLKKRPVLWYSLSAFLKHPAVKRIVIVCRKTELKAVEKIAVQADPEKKSGCEILVTEGGPTRRDSVRLGLKLCRSDAVLVHDAARPFLPENAVDSLMEALDNYKSATLAVPSRDTVKLANEKGEVTATTKRACTWLIQTPQAFDRAAFLEAESRFPEAEVTDDCELMELAGYTVKLVMGSYENRKITAPEDLPKE